MSNDQPPRVPPSPPPVIAYRTPEPNIRNSPGKFFLRALAGVGIGIGMLVLGSLLITLLQPAAPGIGIALFFSPLLVAIVFATLRLFRTGRFGYVTGVLLAPLVAVGLAAVLALMICGIGAMSGAFRP